MEDCPLKNETSRVNTVTIEKFKINDKPYSDNDSGKTLPPIENKADKPKKTKKNSKKRCNHPDCRKKLTLVDTTMGACKCEKLFCSLHRDVSQHNCEFDWHNTKKNELGTVLTDFKCVASKLTKI